MKVCNTMYAISSNARCNIAVAVAVTRTQDQNVYRCVAEVGKPQGQESFFHFLFIDETVAVLVCQFVELANKTGNTPNNRQERHGETNNRVQQRHTSWLASTVQSRPVLSSTAHSLSTKPGRDNLLQSDLAKRRITRLAEGADDLPSTKVFKFCENPR